MLGNSGSPDITRQVADSFAKCWQCLPKQPPVLRTDFTIILLALRLHALDYMLEWRFVKCCRFDGRADAEIHNPAPRIGLHKVTAVAEWAQNVAVWFAMRIDSAKQWDGLFVWNIEVTNFRGPHEAELCVGTQESLAGRVESGSDVGVDIVHFLSV